jgi:hypothetical protein
MSTAHSVRDFGVLIGARGPSVDVGRAGLFAAAAIVSSLVWLAGPILSGDGLSARFWGPFLLGQGVFVASTVLAFRFIPNDWAAAALATVVYAAAMLPVSWWQFSRDIPDVTRLLTSMALFRLTSTFLNLSGLALALKFVTPFWLALAIGGAAAATLQAAVASPLISLTTDGSLSFYSLRDLPQAVADPLIFAACFLVAFALGWVVTPEVATLPAGTAPHVSVLRMKKSLFVGIPAVLIGIADLLALGGVVVARDEPQTAVGLLGLAVPFILAGAVAMFVFVYRMWKCIQDGYARTTPGKAVGLMFVPIYNIYWIFQVLPGFARDYNALLARRHLDLPPLPVGLFTTYIVLSFASVVPVVGLAVGVVQFGVAVVMLSKTCDAVNALPADLPS